jgi:dATP/dGTP diphosphohydrolase, N-terminal
MALPDDARERKNFPIATGVIDYFPDALAEIARVSKTGNEQHNPGTPLHWDRSKSQDEADALMRHFVERGQLDSDGLRHTAKLAWRALALLQKELEGDWRSPGV